MKFWKQCELKKNHLSMTKSNQSRHLLNLKVPPSSMAIYEALHIIVLDIDDQLLCYDGLRKLDRCMMNCNDRLRHFNEMLTH